MNRVKIGHLYNDKGDETNSFLFNGQKDTAISP
ncbi:hypothetical protein J2S19_004897 [Metabacillus malikii]|uniref:Uncharacterized protein n=1 Tax=Metabacillus malikii TaxID=1504265 RepID=A0ABT9ZNH1_9BACI|nr:hypothetical protein [Metabacillus malikii]